MQPVLGGLRPLKLIERDERVGKRRRIKQFRHLLQHLFQAQ
jgi:hypothetical protein